MSDTDDFGYQYDKLDSTRFSNVLFAVHFSADTL